MNEENYIKDKSEPAIDTLVEKPFPPKGSNSDASPRSSTSEIPFNLNPPKEDTGYLKTQLRKFV